ncbi:MAG: hypothetical protein V4543_10705 [Bacteroidota bacterium]
MKAISVKSFLVLNVALLLSVGMLTFSCKKDKDDDSAKPDQATINAEISKQSVQAADESALQAESDDAIALATDTVLAEMPNYYGGRLAAVSVCGGTITKDSADRSFTITFDNSSICANKIRSGSIKVKLTTGNHFRDAGSVLSLTFTDYNVRRTIGDSTRNFKFNGTHTVENVNGGQLASLTVSNPVVWKIRGNMSINFDNGTVKRSWKVYRKRTFAREGVFNYTSTLEGDTTINSVSGFTEVGTNRFGDDYTVQVSTPVVSGNLCGWWRPKSGVKLFSGIKHNITLTYGVNALGSPVESGCAGFFKIAWNGADGVARTKVIRY